ncbi:MAG: Uncharacterized MFS-type transporter, partial [uncultured Microvirga sp.]
MRPRIRASMIEPVPPTFRATLVRVLLPFALGYFLSFLYRTVNAVIGPEVAADLGLGPAEIGLLTSAYFLTFAAFQIPLGVLLDRYGPRRVEAALLLVAALGAILFSAGTTASALAVGRGLIGLGVSACLMAAMKANAQWWPPERLALANGTTLAIGGLGALVATAPVEFALAYTHWRGIFVGLAGLTVAVALAIFVVVPKTGARRADQGWGAAFRGALGIYKEPVFIRIAPLAMLNQACFLSYHGLWAVAWMRDVDGLDRAAAASVLAIATTGIIFGTFGVGFAADRLARRGVSTLTVAVTGSAIYLLVQFGLVMRAPLPGALMWGLFAFFGMSSTLY